MTPPPFPSALFSLVPHHLHAPPPVARSAQANLYTSFSFQVRAFYGSGQFQGPQALGEHFYFEPFRNPAGTDIRETPDLWWISRGGDFGYGYYGEAYEVHSQHIQADRRPWAWQSTGLVGDARAMSRDTQDNPNEWNTWNVRRPDWIPRTWAGLHLSCLVA